MTDQTPAAPRIHPTAIVDEGAKLGNGVEVGAYAIIGPNVKVGDHTIVAPHAYIEKDTRVGSRCFIAKGAVLGTDPQDLKFEGEDTLLVVGDDTTIREFATLNRGTRAAGRTTVGSGCLIMAYAHVAHDCAIGDQVVIANAVQMGGHVTIENCATVGGLVAIHQFVRIGAYSFIGGASRVPKDVPPYVRAAGNPLALYGLNTVGLERRGFSDEARRELKRAYRLLFGSDLNISQAMAELRSKDSLLPEVERLLDFIDASERGVSV
ncbi:MAG: acyl-ACP--UDP-N-acetylglucosamine O-acyltransferase [Gemmatimonadetes bacterium]|uniref:Acyl-[acyl-carrier-protein]--UDP-N-acetylglucosamine O-acyltransferase n=1 Tax=Candidatus Kutchimonas denitrificans TaxID=3056748 RepID=A0AAE4ZBM4_9BACT|nr:acyl-ACP--UDP-N-acetylglucosamine O-acyltransferase [Gemmatimonadota bacterium]NIR75281.1 acyl-ACP--UDP-N-acetylglucosamine O-acyltransferase [Candidatus Kutchimonas denitrificans]NIS00219.1 acyl-ACP--UDP-N-acetylglucosamine O-acyltransferase [Gemmatimonadota bacterium]NIT65811.1 acyl-ACP--UDP-N-acetylglucosamine O-acyltransferase [Gemmatimonadota bacterium]NIU53089.1 acyl-ACP--UDP-N-acetylglucosamine O-acyltransferase [Gemmatimonadota bacterium]